MKPIIGVTCNHLPRTTGDGLDAIGFSNEQWAVVATDYTNAVERAGGIPVMMPFYEDAANIKEFVAKLDGIVITGGDDVNPLLYGEDVTSLCGPVNNVRDAQEVHLLHELFNGSDIPVLGVCRGNQMLNVHFGGTLMQDNKSLGYYHSLGGSATYNSFAHRVLLEKGTLIHEVVGDDSILTNSYHHQNIKELAGALKAGGHTADGIIESVELPGSRFVLGVQWHPEMTPQCEINQRIYKALIKASSK